VSAGCGTRPFWSRRRARRPTTATNWPDRLTAAWRQGTSPRPSDSSACWPCSAQAIRPPGWAWGPAARPEARWRRPEPPYDAVLQDEFDNVHTLANRAEVFLLRRGGARADLDAARDRLGPRGAARPPCCPAGSNGSGPRPRGPSLDALPAGVPP
jgi:hypothetical protein